MLRKNAARDGAAFMKTAYVSGNYLTRMQPAALGSWLGCEVPLEVGGGDEVAVEVGAAYFDYGDFALGKCTLDGYAAERLEVVAEDEALCLVDANGAVGHDHFVAVGVDFGGVGHE